MKNTLLLLFCSFLMLHSFGQVKKDLDGDGINDEVDYDASTSKITCKLSSQNFKAISSKANLSDELNTGVRVTKSGFEFFVAHMRAGYANQFRYDKATKQIQLIGMSRYEFGPANNNGSGESSVNLLTGQYIGDWNYYNLEQSELIKMPTIKTKMLFKKMYLQNYDGSYQSIYEEKCGALYYQYKKKVYH